MLGDTFQKAYKTAPETTRKLIDSTTIPLCIEDELLANHLPITLKRNLIRIYVDLRLGLILREEAAEQISSLGIPEAEEFLAHIDLRVAQTKNHLDGIEVFEKELLETQSRMTRPTPTQSLESTINETEAALRQLPPTHTMASDAKKIRGQGADEETPVYQSTQPTLRPGNPLRGPNAPTWGD